MANEVIKAQNEPETLHIVLTPFNYPTAFENKVSELLEQEAFKTREEAVEWIIKTPIVLEVFYEKDYGLFAVESGAVESGVCSSPYTNKEIICDENY